MYKKFIMLFLLLINVGFASAALSWGEWSANNNEYITITNGQMSEFEWTVQAVSSFQGVQGKYSIWLFREGNNNPIKTYFSNQPTVNNGAGGYINVTPSEYQNLIGDYQVKIYSSDYFGADTHTIYLTVIPAQNPLTVSCSANPASGQAPLTTTYSATVSGGSGIYNSYYWNFNDGQTQTTSTNNVQHTYQNSGTYNGIITVTDNQGHTATANCPTITVTPQPIPITVSCNAYPTNGTTPLDVAFTATATGGSGVYNNYAWNFKDGTTQNTNNANINHIYTALGLFTPTVTVTDSQGHQGTGTCPAITVNEYIAPLQSTCYAEPTNGTAPLTTEFTGLVTGGKTPYTYKWIFGNGQTQTTTNNEITHTYQNAGTYYPKLTVDDSSGRTITSNCPTITAHTQVQPLTITCSAYPTNGITPLNVAFTATANGGSGVYTNYAWNFKDGTTQNTNNANTNHNYITAGNYIPTVTVTDNEGRTKTANCPTITATVPPLNGVCYAQPTSGKTPLKVNFTVTATGGSGTYNAYGWDFLGNGQLNTQGNKTSYTYTVQGTYNPKVTIYDSNGQSKIINCPTITATTLPPITGTCYANPTNGTAPLTTQFQVTATGGSGTYNAYGWDFLGNNQTNTQGNTATYTYQNAGTYKPDVTVYDNQGNQGTINCPTINVQAPLPTLTATCDAYPTSGYKPLNVNFTGTATGGSGIYYYYWFFDDEQSEYGQSKITHTYSNTGIFNPTLKVTDSQNHIVTVSCPTITVSQEPIINYTLTCDANPKTGYAPLNVNFDAAITTSITTDAPSRIADAPSRAWTYTWTFNDGQSLINGPNVWHTYNQGTFHPTVKATNGIITLNAQCPEIKVSEYIEPLTASCDAYPTTGDIPLDVNFTGTANGGTGNYQYKWTFNDGQTQTTTINKITHTYQNNGTFHPTLKVTDSSGNFVTTACPTITATTCEPITGTCIINPTTGYAPLDVNITINAEGGSGTYTIYKYLFGDGQTQTTSNYKTTHTYQNTGYYNPKAIVTDSDGNTGLIYCEQVKVIEEPINNTLVCIAYPTNGTAPLDVEFNAQGLEGFAKINTNAANPDCYTSTWTYTWIFDDGQTLTNGANVWHTYNEGTFNPTVQATDGCETLYAECPEIIVNEQPPEPLTASCNAYPTSGHKPLNVNFTGTANGGTGNYQYKWTFDDGQNKTTTINKTTHKYYNQGTYHPTLKVTDGTGHTTTTNCPTITVTSCEPITGTCTVNPTTGYEPLDVNITINAQGGSGTYTSYKYIFGDGQSTTITSNKITHTYQNTGYYWPKAIITDDHGHTGTINCTKITVNEQPPEPLTASCNAYPTSGHKPLNVNFYGSVSGGSGTYYYYWFFDDDTSQYAQNETTHTYTRNGTFNPTLKITDSQNHIITVNCPEITVTHYNPTPITGTCIADPTNGYKPLTTNFTVYATGGSGTYTAYKWTFDDGTLQSTTNHKTTHTYNNIGEYNPTVKVIDTEGHYGVINCPEINVYVQPPNQTLECIAYPTTGYEPLEVEFNANIPSESNNANTVDANTARTKITNADGTDCYTSTWTYTWTFDDGQTLINGANVWHTYNKGTFNPTVQATDGCETLYAECPEITVNEQPVQNITGTCTVNPTTGYEPLDVNITINAQGGSGTYTSYKYIFGDGQTTTQTSNKITHTYQNTGYYWPKAIVTDEHGHTGTINCTKITVNEQPTTLTATCNANPTVGYVPLETTFTGTASGGTGGYQYKWIFGDGNYQLTTLQTVLHTYYNIGTFHPTLKVTDSSGDFVTTSCPTINVNQNPIINHTLICDATPTNGYEPLNVNFDAQLEITQNGMAINPDSINKYYDTATGIECYDNTMTWTYKWIFDDGQTLFDGSNVWHTYNKGTFYPLVQATKGCITLTVECPTINVQENVNSDITGTCHVEPNNGNAPLTTELTVEVNGGSGIYTNYAWNFDDGTTQSTIIHNVFYTYNNVGEYTPSVVVTDNNGNTGTIICPTINVEYSNYILIADPNGPYKDYVNTQIMFDGSGSQGEIVRYVWDFGDGITVENIVPYAYHAYNNKIGVFPVKLTVYDIHGHMAVGHTTATIIEPTNFKQDKDRVKDGLWVGKIIVVGKDGIQEVVRSNDEVKFSIELENDYEYDLDDARIIIEIPELGIKQKSTSFDLRTGQEKSQSITVPIWNAPEGWYEVKIIVQDDNVKRVKFRDIFVSDTYKKECIECKAGVY